MANLRVFVNYPMNMDNLGASVFFYGTEIDSSEYLTYFDGGYGDYGINEGDIWKSNGGTIINEIEEIVNGVYAYSIDWVTSSDRFADIQVARLYSLIKSHRCHVIHLPRQ